MHLTKKNICPYCKGKLQPTDEKCQNCGKTVRFKKKPSTQEASPIDSTDSSKGTIL
jgi:predicted amidophosphoribosyltransferase